MSGGSTKFLCDFTDAKSKDGKNTKKVRYASSSFNPLNSEVVETMMASNIAALIGLPTKIFCPAVINCKGCPSTDPWRDDRGSKPAGSKIIELEWSLVESSVEAYMLSTKNGGNAPDGVDYVEIKNVKADNPEERKKKLIEREAWMLWISFIQNTDMGSFNLRLICQEYEKNSDNKYYCKKPYIYARDYGHSFYRHLTYSKWSSIPVFERSDKNSGCKAGFNQDSLPMGQIGLKGILIGAEFSAEARDLLYERLSLITDEQWVTVFQISRAEEASKVKSNKWLSDVKKKLSQMKSANCLPFDAGKSVLF